MSESIEKKPRSLAEVQAEYGRVCARAGHTQYQVKQLTKELEMINETLQELNIEGAASQAAEQKAAEEKAKAASDVAEVKS